MVSSAGIPYTYAKSKMGYVYGILRNLRRFTTSRRLEGRAGVISDYFCTVATDSGGTWRNLVELAGMPWWRLRYQSDIDNHTLATDFVGSNAY